MPTFYTQYIIKEYSDNKIYFKITIFVKMSPCDTINCSSCSGNKSNLSVSFRIQRSSTWLWIVIAFLYHVTNLNKLFQTRFKGMKHYTVIYDRRTFLKHETIALWFKWLPLKLRIKISSYCYGMENNIQTTLKT